MTNQKTMGKVLVKNNELVYKELKHFIKEMFKVLLMKQNVV